MNHIGLHLLFRSALHPFNCALRLLGLSRQRIPFAILLFIGTIGIFWSCQKHPSSPESRKLIVEGSSLPPGRVTKIDDYPLFVMNYSGDYGFRNVLSQSTPGDPTDQRNRSRRSPSWGCTCFSATGDSTKKIFGRNFDYYHHIAMVVYTQPTDAYASLSTVDLYYLGFSTESTVEDLEHSPRIRSAPLYPFDGLNEKGVAIGMMALATAEPPYDPSKPSLSCLQMIRLVLDYAASTQEAVALLGKCNYSVEDPPVHFLIADQSGTSAVVEYIGQKMIVHWNTEPYQVCTNFAITGSSAPTSTPCWRYDKAYQELATASGCMDDARSGVLLNAVSQSITMWSAVYRMDAFSVKIAAGRNFKNFQDIVVQ